ncbi:hypothetical protein MF672_022170 [Actinomadura sp. ATCC 31491]|uniref:CBS domain-containing protein n=1 Tax=Actinomadura luzonensis TaxID=2805427 RepID=A0ABT0FVX8_9ACTN|nr:hypothetical protein [Actinomadura luzonensis]MCK2216488.1 hypothetical protein [Actinomadura luzonensis]
MILGIDAGSRTLAEAEHLLHTVARALGLPPDAIGCTHFVPAAGDREPHVACSLELPDDAADPVPPEGVSWALGARRGGPLAEGTALAAREHAARDGGRAVTYPGRERLTGVLTVADLLAGSAIERVTVLASPGPPDPGTEVATAGHVRPVWRDGVLTLPVMPAVGGRLAPAEVPHPTPCCADHG